MNKKIRALDTMQSQGKHHDAEVSDAVTPVEMWVNMRVFPDMSDWTSVRDGALKHHFASISFENARLDDVFRVLQALILETIHENGVPTERRLVSVGGVYRGWFRLRCQVALDEVAPILFSVIRGQKEQRKSIESDDYLLSLSSLSYAAQCFAQGDEADYVQDTAWSELETFTDASFYMIFGAFITDVIDLMVPGLPKDSRIVQRLSPVWEYFVNPKTL